MFVKKKKDIRIFRCKIYHLWMVNDTKLSRYNYLCLFVKSRSLQHVSLSRSCPDDVSLASRWLQAVFPIRVCKGLWILLEHWSASRRYCPVIQTDAWWAGRILSTQKAVRTKTRESTFTELETAQNLLGTLKLPSWCLWH